MEYIEQRNEGTALVAKAARGYSMAPLVSSLEAVLETPEIKEHVEGYTWVPYPLRAITGGQQWQLETIGGIFGGQCSVYGVSPNYLDTVYSPTP